MEANKEQYGMQSFDQALADLVTTKQISFHAAMAAASKPADFELKLRMFSRMSASVQMSDMPQEDQAPLDTPGGVAAIGGGSGGGMDFMR
jgi:Tfp pilus assembly ATPase PilU